MAKRAIAFLMCVMLALTAVCALAASPGETVNVVLKANSDPKGAVIAKVALEYDHTVFEVVKVIDQTGKESTFKTGENITYISTEALTNGGSLSDTVVFKIKDGAADGPYQIKGTVTEAYDIDGNAVTFTVAPFEIVIGGAAGRVPGDVNGDGDLTLVDLALVKRKLAGWTITTTFIEANASVDGNDTITLVDAAMIARKLAGWDVTLK